MYHRWSSSHFFEWTPILTYTRRHLHLLEWFEQHTKPVSFIEGPGRVGVALVADDLRITVTRSGMMVDSGLSGLSINRLMPAIEGVFEVLEPQDTVLSSSWVTSTVELSEVDLHEKQAEFAWKVGSARSFGEGFRSMDGSALLDLQSPDLTVQVEWGIVGSEELLYRLRHPKVGRIERPNEAGETAGLSLDQDVLPSVSVFADIVATRRAGAEVADPSAAEAVIDAIRGSAEGITVALEREFTTKEGDR